MKVKILKKNILKEENCGGSAAPIGLTPNETLPVAGDVTQMSPEQAFDAGYNAAIEEIMAMVGDMIAGGIPVDMAVPADIAHMDQLEEKWKGDAEIEQTGKWADKTVAQLKKRKKELMDKEERTEAEQEEVREINFAIRAKTGWKRGKGATK
jgi:hypothetical protein